MQVLVARVQRVARGVERVRRGAPRGLEDPLHEQIGVHGGGLVVVFAEGDEPDDDAAAFKDGQAVVDIVVVIIVVVVVVLAGAPAALSVRGEGVPHDAKKLERRDANRRGVPVVQTRRDSLDAVPREHRADARQLSGRVLYARGEIDGIATEREILVTALQRVQRVLGAAVRPSPAARGVRLDRRLGELLQPAGDEVIDPFNRLDSPAPIGHRLQQIQHPERERRDGVLLRRRGQHLVRGGSHLRTRVRRAHHQVLDETRGVENEIHRRRTSDALRPFIVVVVVAAGRSRRPARPSRVPASRAGQGTAGRPAVARHRRESLVPLSDGVMRRAFFIECVFQRRVLILSVFGEIPRAVQPRDSVQRTGHLASVEQHAPLRLLRLASTAGVAKALKHRADGFDRSLHDVFVVIQKQLREALRHGHLRLLLGSLRSLTTPALLAARCGVPLPRLLLVHLAEQNLLDQLPLLVFHLLLRVLVAVHQDAFVDHAALTVVQPRADVPVHQRHEPIRRQELVRVRLPEADVVMDPRDIRRHSVVPSLEVNESLVPLALSLALTREVTLHVALAQQRLPAKVLGERVHRLGRLEPDRAVGGVQEEASNQRRQLAALRAHDAVV